MNWAIVNDENIIVNVIVWDGNSSYNPGEGLHIVELPENKWIGDSINVTEQP